MYSGKKTEKFWLPKRLVVDPFLAARVRNHADENFRKIEDELRFLIMRGLDATEQGESNGQNVPLRSTKGQTS